DVDAIKSRFGGNDESKKMQKYILKQQLEGFSVSNTEGLHKGYDRFQSLLSQLEIHGAGVSTEDANKIPKISTFCLGILLESVESREIKITGGGMHGILEPRMGAELERRRTLKHYSESDTEVTSCSNKCKESYVNLKKLYDAQREQLSDASIEIKAIKLKVLEIEDKAQKEKEDLKAKVEKWHNSSKNLSKLLNTQMSANDKFGLGFECQPRFWFLGFFAPIIEEYESDSEDETIHIKSFKGIRIVEGGCSSNDWKPRLLCDFQGLNGGPVTFGGSKVLTDLRGKKRRLMRELNVLGRRLTETENLIIQAGAAKASSTNIFSIVSTPAKASSTNLVNTVSTPVSTASPHVVADFTNLETVVNVSPIPTSRIISSHPSALILGDPTSAVQTRSKVNKSSGAHAFVSYVQKQRRNNHKDFQHCLFACFLSQNEPKKISEALEDENLPFGKKAIGTKWVYRNKKDERGVVVRNKARIEAIRIFLAFASYMGFIVYQMDVKSAFLYGKIDEEVYVSQPPGFLDPKYPQKVYKVVKALYGLHQAPRAWTYHDIILVQVYVDDIIFGSTKKSWCDEFEALMKSRFQMRSIRELTFFLGLQFKLKEDGIFISQDKYVAEILKKFEFANVKTASTPIETQKPLVTSKSSHLSDVKRIFRYLKGKPKLGLWYPRVSSFDLESYSNSDYARANLDRKSTIGVVQFLAARLILGMLKADHCDYFYYRGNMLLLQAVVGKFCDSKSI
ncbi:retrovirus-related pol polyprotein from transposon TNT 1-94, partial [Tanacetum coccineum]